MSRAYVFTADGMEEIEGLSVVDVLRRGGVDVKMVALGDTKKVHGSHGIDFEADLTYAEADTDAADALILPGGLKGTQNLMAHGKLGEALKKAAADGRYVCAICAAPSVLGGLGLLQGKRATCYPGFEEKLTGADATGRALEADGNIITGRAMGSAVLFSLRILEALEGEECAKKTAKAIVFE